VKPVQGFHFGEQGVDLPAQHGIEAGRAAQADRRGHEEWVAFEAVARSTPDPRQRHAQEGIRLSFSDLRCAIWLSVAMSASAASVCRSAAARWTIR